MPGQETSALPPSNMYDLDAVLFKHDRIYRHNIMRINYTTYDVLRKQDTINPSTPHRDIMILSNRESPSDHPFLYARVIGIFHVNVIYTGSQTVDYHPRRIEFLWVQWFEHTSSAVAGSWAASTLDRLRFPPMADEDSFGFLDPADVIRCAHILPAFATGKRYIDGKGLSSCAMDSGDWRSYYVSRCVPVRPFQPHDTDLSFVVLRIAIFSCVTTGALRLDTYTLTTNSAHTQGYCGPLKITILNTTLNTPMTMTRKLRPAADNIVAPRETNLKLLTVIRAPVPGAIVIS
jgi:hypothetical protein